MLARYLQGSLLTLHAISRARRNRAWWHKPILLALGLQRRDYRVAGNTGTKNEFKASVDYLGRQKAKRREENGGLLLLVGAPPLQAPLGVPPPH